MKKTIPIVLLLVMALPFTAALAQDEAIFMEWKAGRDEKVVNLVSDWLINDIDEVNGDDVVNIIRLSINMLSFTRERDPYLEVENPECLQAQIFEAWLNKQEVSFEANDIFLGRTYHFAKTNIFGEPVQISGIR